MKLLLAVLALISAGPVAADCPKAADWARVFYSEHYSFYAEPSDRVLQVTTPEFGALLKREWEYSNGEIGHLDYDPWLGGQDGEEHECWQLQDFITPRGDSLSYVYSLPQP
jgi:hypothetical protein